MTVIYWDVPKIKECADNFVLKIYKLIADKNRFISFKDYDYFVYIVMKITEIFINKRILYSAKRVVTMFWLFPKTIR